MFLNATFDLDRRKQLGCDFLSATLGCQKKKNTGGMDSKSTLGWLNVTKTEYTPLDVHLQRRGWKCCPFSPCS